MRGSVTDCGRGWGEMLRSSCVGGDESDGFIDVVDHVWD